MYSLNISTKGTTMSFQDTTFTSLNVDSDTGMITLGIATPGSWPQDLRSGMWLKLVPAKTVQEARTSDMQDLVDRCEAKTKAPEKGWSKATRNDITYIYNENCKTVAMIPATWWLMSQTDEERAAELRQRREDYFTNVPLVLNAKRMFDLLDELCGGPTPVNDTLARARELMVQIKTQQWKPEHPTQG